MSTLRTLAVAALSAALSLTLSPAASAEGNEEVYGGGVSHKFGKHDQLAFRLMSWHQVWLRAIENNPGTVVDGSRDAWTADIMLRRSRVLLMAELTDRVLLVTHFGINNQTFTNGGAGTDGFRPQLYLHDAYGEVTLVPQLLSLGAGLHYWNGISRSTSASTLTLLGLDAPLVAWPTIDATDQFARQLGVYAKGDIEAFHYRVAVNRPFIRDAPSFVTPAAAQPAAAYNAEANTFALTGYVDYAFFERENHKLPYYTGSYLGTKRVANVGVGVAYQPSAMAYCSETPDADGCPAGAQQTADLIAFGVDSFLDLPFGQSAVTSYLGYFFQEFGPDHQRTLGIANLASNGPYFGNASPAFGTGHHLNLQLGYLLPYRPFGDHKLTLYGTLTGSLLEQKDDPAVTTELGGKYYLVGHHTSFTLNWRNRPVYVGQDATDAFVPTTTVETRASEFMLQLHVWL
jgi:hypothetical protein